MKLRQFSLSRRDSGIGRYCLFDGKTVLWPLATRAPYFIYILSPVKESSKTKCPCQQHSALVLKEHKKTGLAM
jgi:hypothetical protein